jgi:hypothetical protein
MQEGAARWEGKGAAGWEGNGARRQMEALLLGQEQLQLKSRHTHELNA